MDKGIKKKRINFERSREKDLLNHDVFLYTLKENLKEKALEHYLEAKGKVQFDSTPFFSFSYNSNQGRIRKYNEDRVCVKVNLPLPSLNNNDNEEKKRVWHYFGIFDGHAGKKCADFLKNNFFEILVQNKFFPNKISKALKEAFFDAEKLFYEKNKPLNLIDNYEKSGSCAIVVIIYGDVCYCANVGDSRAIYSEKGSEIVKQLSVDHKPETKSERDRITKAGGSVYQNKKNSYSKDIWRVIPGKLSVLIKYN